MIDKRGKIPNTGWTNPIDNNTSWTGGVTLLEYEEITAEEELQPEIGSKRRINFRTENTDWTIRVGRMRKKKASDDYPQQILFVMCTKYYYHYH